MIKRFEELTEKQLADLRYCARERCVDCTLPCYSAFDLSWDEWSRFANLYYASEKERRQVKDMI
jgi:hypothetical protein